MSPHPAVARLRHYEWLAGQAAAFDRALSGLVLTGSPAAIVDSQRDALIDAVAKLDAAHAEVRRSLTTGR